MDERGVALISATVSIPFITTNATTDNEGNYTINLPETETNFFKLVASYTGYYDQEILFDGNTSIINFQLKEGNSGNSKPLIYVFSYKAEKKKTKGILKNMVDIPLKESEIQLYKGLNKTELYQSVFTDSNGKFKLKIKESGQYIIVINAYQSGLSGEKIEWSFEHKKFTALKIYAKEVGTDLIYIKLSD